MNAFADLLAAPAPPAREPPDTTNRLVVKSSGQILFLPLRTLRYVEAQGDYMKFHGDGQSALVRATMKTVAARLASRQFLRIHRSTIVNVDHIARITQREDGRLSIVLLDGTGLLVSTGCRQKVREFYRREMDPALPRHTQLRSAFGGDTEPLPRFLQ